MAAHVREAGRPASPVEWVDRAITLAATTISITALVVMFAALCAEVVVRYVTKTSLGWPAELPNFMFPWLVMSGIVLAAQHGAHISVTLLLGKIGRGAQRTLSHGGGDFLGDGAVLLQQCVGNSDHGDLRFVGIADEATVHGLGRARDCREGAGDQAASATLCGRDCEAIGDQGLDRLLGERCNIVGELHPISLLAWGVQSKQWPSRRFLRHAR